MSKEKTKAKKTKTKARTKIKSKTKVKTKVKERSKKKKKSKIKNKVKAIKFNNVQKEELLIWIEKIVNLHKGEKGGLKSFTGIDEILNKFNQQYTEIDEKFDAIAKFGVERDPRVIHEHFFMNVEGREKDVNELFILLAKIAKGKINYTKAKEKIKFIYEESLAVHS